MARDKGFRSADIAVDLLQDPKVRRLRANHEDRWPAYLMAYVVILLDSWREGQRLAFAECRQLGLPEDAGEVLRDFGLLDDEFRVPLLSWDSWFGPAYNRRAALRARVARHRAADFADLVKAFPGGR